MSADARACSIRDCDSHARWRIGSGHASCDPHLRAVTAMAFAAANSAPYLPTCQESA